MLYLEKPYCTAVPDFCSAKWEVEIEVAAKVEAEGLGWLWTQTSCINRLESRYVFSTPSIA